MSRFGLGQPQPLKAQSSEVSHERSGPSYGRGNANAELEPKDNQSLRLVRRRVCADVLEFADGGGAGGHTCIV